MSDSLFCISSESASVDRFTGEGETLRKRKIGKVVSGCTIDLPAVVDGDD